MNTDEILKALGVWQIISWTMDFIFFLLKSFVDKYSTEDEDDEENRMDTTQKKQ